MGRKIFVSYKHQDGNVEALNSSNASETTARDYVEHLIKEFPGENKIVN